MSEASTPDAQLILFDTTHHALWSEEVARQREIPAELVSSPAAAKAKCGLALRTTPELLGRLTEALSSEGITFRLFP